MENVKYASKDYWEKTCSDETIFGNTWGTRWKAYTKIRYKKYYELISKFIFVGGGNHKKILDLGCSDGDFLNYIYNKNKNNEYYGVDIAKSAIQVLKKRFPHFHGTVCSLDSIDEYLNVKFDVIVCAGVLQCLDEDEYYNVFNAISKVIRDDGVLLIEYPNNMSITKERQMIRCLRDKFYIKSRDYEFGGLYIELFSQLWRESFALAHPNLFLWIITLIILSNYPLAVLSEKVTEFIGDKKRGISGKILILKKRT